ncbi:MAG: RsmE family RNA methyltransferase, partial [Chloroflexota bacterium]|nr:RsmE family RNA methyltransferase [Chloroflexota bacterium]
TARTVAGVAPGDRGKLERWRRIVREAAEQSGRGRVPEVAPPLGFGEACRLAAGMDHALIPWEGERARGLRATLDELVAAGPVASLALFIGPEGGFTPEEIAEAQGHDIRPVTLGPRVLRADTAATVALALALAALGDLD